MATPSSSSSSSTAADQPTTTPLPPPSFLDQWRERIFYPTLLGGIVGGAIGAMSKHRKVHGVANMSATYATNFAIVSGVYCGAREFVRVTRKSEHGDLINSALGGFCSGAVLGRLQGGQHGAVRYSIVFAVVGTGVDYATLKLQPLAKSYYDSLFASDLKLPEWSPIQILDEEALAAKRAREEQLRAQRAITISNKES
ncbi:uncharacterized protein LOC141591902 [Silene latifolia]|uniref:uncharacterized protein LOC141591902 n=1 Tax=Silene latifolia TaxID=37657 RepID=UPI003D77C587